VLGVGLKEGVSVGCRHFKYAAFRDSGNFFSYNAWIFAVLKAMRANCNIEGVVPKGTEVCVGYNKAAASDERSPAVSVVEKGINQYVCARMRIVSGPQV
jgi:hypothetical protein